MRGPSLICTPRSFAPGHRSGPKYSAVGKFREGGISAGRLVFRIVLFLAVSQLPLIPSWKFWKRAIPFPPLDHPIHHIRFMYFDLIFRDLVNASLIWEIGFLDQAQ